AHGDIARAWPYLRAVGDSEKIAAAIDRYQSGEDVDAIISIAFNEGVHPAKGLELIFQKYGMCRALTSFGMYGAQNGREKCIALLVRELHADVVERMARTIE